MVKKCSDCKSAKILSEFSLNKTTGDSYNGICVKCSSSRVHKWQRANREKQRAFVTKWDNANRPHRRSYMLKSLYGMTDADYEQMKAAQGGACAICKKLDLKLCVDHDHSTGKVRGLLCDPCNKGLGHFRDDITTVKRIISYLGGE